MPSKSERIVGQLDVLAEFIEKANGSFDPITFVTIGPSLYTPARKIGTGAVVPVIHTMATPKHWERVSVEPTSGGVYHYVTEEIDGVQIDYGLKKLPAEVK